MHQSRGAVEKAQEDTRPAEARTGHCKQVWAEDGSAEIETSCIFCVLPHWGFPLLERPFLIADTRGPAAPESDCKQEQNDLPFGQVSPRVH